MDALNPAQPTQFTSPFSVTSQAVSAYGKNYPLGTIKGIEVLPMPFIDSWRTLVTIVVYMLGFAIIWVAGSMQPWSLPFDPARLVPVLATVLAVVAIAVLLRLEHRRRSAKWRYMYGVWLRMKNDMTLVALYPDEAEAAAVAARIKQALDTGETSQPVEYYREDHTVRIDPGAVEVDGRVYPIANIKTALAVNYTYQSMLSTVLNCVYKLLFVAFVTQIHLPLVASIAAILLLLLVVIGAIYYINKRYNYVETSCKLRAAGLFTTDGYVDAVVTPDAAYANSIIAAVNQVLQTSSPHDLRSSPATPVRQVR